MKRISHKAAAQREIQRRVRRAVESAGLILQQEIKGKLSQSGSTRAGGNTPSVPGTPPAVQTGTLRRSIQVDNSRAVGPDPRVRVGTNLVYARIHEYGGTINHPGGTAYIMRNGAPVFISNRASASMPGVKRTKPHPIRIPMRPYMRPAYLAARTRMTSTVQAVLRGVR